MTLKPPGTPNTPLEIDAADALWLGNLGATSSYTMDERAEVWLEGTLTADHVATIAGREGAVVRYFLTQDGTGGHTFTIVDASDDDSLAVPIASGAADNAVVTVRGTPSGGLWATLE